jgi:hypothetical protein
MLNGFVWPDVQWTVKSIVNRIHERGHANKVSMKKRKEEEKRKNVGGREEILYS